MEGGRRGGVVSSGRYDLHRDGGEDLWARDIEFWERTEVIDCTRVQTSEVAAFEARLVVCSL